MNFKGWTIFVLVVLTAGAAEGKPGTRCSPLVLGLAKVFPWMKASRDLKYMVQVEIVDEGTDTLMGSGVFSSYQSEDAVSAPAGKERQFGKILMPIERLGLNKSPSLGGVDPRLMGNPIFFVTAQVELLPTSAWRKSGQAKIALNLADETHPDRTSHIKTLFLNGDTKPSIYRSVFLNGYVIRVQSQWVPYHTMSLEGPTTKKLSVPNHLEPSRSWGELNLQIYEILVKRNQTNIEVPLNPSLKLSPGEDTMVGPDEIWNDSQEPVDVYITESGIMGMHYKHAVLVNKSGKIVRVFEIPLP